MIRVLFVNDNLRLPAGITVVMNNIIDNFPNSEVEFSILTIQSNKNNALNIFSNKGVKIFYMPGATTTSTNNRLKRFLGRINIFTFFSLKTFFKRFFQEHTFDIVHSHFSQIDRIMFPIAKSNGVKCCISHSHSSQLSDSKFRALRNKLLCRDLLNIADYCVACSNSAGIALFGKDFLLSPKKKIIKNGISVSNFTYNENSRKEIRKRYNLDEKTLLIGTVGRLNKVKNQSFLIEVLAKLNNRNHTYKLMLVGCGELESFLKQKSSRLGLNDDVIFAGSQNDISPYLSAFDIFVMPSLHEGLGIAAIEAQVNGLECIVSSSVPQEVDLTGVRFLNLNEGATVWGETISTLLKQHHSEFPKIVIDAGYDIKTVCEDLYLFYKNIID